MEIEHTQVYLDFKEYACQQAIGIMTGTKTVEELQELKANIEVHMCDATCKGMPRMFERVMITKLAAHILELADFFIEEQGGVSRVG